MRKFIFVFILISLIYIAFNSPCSDKKLETSNNESTNTINPTNTETENTDTTTSEENKEQNQGQQDAGAGTGTGTGDNRRLDLTQNDCKDLKTEDDEKYQCRVSSDGKKCEEVKKENSKIVFLSLTILIFLFLF